MRYLILT